MLPHCGIRTGPSSPPSESCAICARTNASCAIWTNPVASCGRRLVDPVGVLEAAIDAVQGLADAKEIELRAFLDPDAGPILADPDRLQQVVWNLLSNSIKFSPARGHIEINLERAGPVARITV